MKRGSDGSSPQAKRMMAEPLPAMTEPPREFAIFDQATMNPSTDDPVDQIAHQGLGVGSRVELLWTFEALSEDEAPEEIWCAGTIKRRSNETMSFGADSESEEPFTLPQYLVEYDVAEGQAVESEEICFWQDHKAISQDRNADGEEDEDCRMAWWRKAGYH